MNELVELKERLKKHKEVASNLTIRKPLKQAAEGIDRIVEDSKSLRDEAIMCIDLLIDHYDKTKQIGERCNSLKNKIKEIQKNLKEKAVHADRETMASEYNDIQDRRISVGDDLMKLNMIDANLLTYYITLDVAPLIIRLYVSFDDEYFKMLLPEKEKILPSYLVRAGRAIPPLIGNIPIVGNVMSLIEAVSKYAGRDDLKSTKNASDTMDAVHNINTILPHWINSCPQYLENIKNVKRQIQGNIDEMDLVLDQLQFLDKKYHG